MAMSLPGFLAGGNISPARFVKMSDEYTVIQCTAGSDEPCGVSPPWVRYAPNTPWDNGYTAIAGQDTRIWQESETCSLESGNTFAGGAYLMSDANGRAITATATNYYGAQALESATASGQRIPVKVTRGLVKT